MPFRCFCFLAMVSLIPLRADDPDAFQVWGSLVLRAHRLNEQGKSGEAIDVAKKALEIAKSFGPNDTNIAVTHQMLGIAYRDAGNCAESRASFSRAIAIWQAQPDPSKKHLFNSIISLLNGVCECGDSAGAEKLYRLYREPLEQSVNGPLDRGRLEAFEAFIARSKKHYAEAETHLREALRIYDEMPKPPVRDVSQTEASLGVILDLERRLPEALEYELKALDGLVETAPYNLGTIAAFNNVACTLSRLGRGSEAERYLATATGMATRQLGENNSISAQILLNYSRILKENKQTEEAEAMLKRAKAASHQAALRDNQTVDIQDLKLGLR
jgi:tetratricopeptide (TPR) repeat protein